MQQSYEGHVLECQHDDPLLWLSCFLSLYLIHLIVLERKKNGCDLREEEDIASRKGIPAAHEKREHRPSRPSELRKKNIPEFTRHSLSLGQNLGHWWVVLDSKHLIDMEESGTLGTNSTFLFPPEESSLPLVENLECEPMSPEWECGSRGKGREKILRQNCWLPETCSGCLQLHCPMW